MSTIAPLHAIVTVLAAALALIAVWAPRRLAAKTTAIAAAALLMLTGHAALVGLLSRPKPVALEWWLGRATEATVLGSTLAEGEAIHLWLQLDGVAEPRAYVLAWDRRLAEQLQAASRAAAESGSTVRMRLPFERSLDDAAPRFHAMPQPALPPKDAADPPPRLFSHPSTEA